MLLHDNYIPFFVNLQAVVVFHFKVKCTNCIFCVKCISIMADSDKTLIGDGNISNNNRKTSAPNIVPSMGTMQPDTHPTHHVAMSESSALKRKQASFQITSVTVKGSRLSTDGGDDSADDLDESHTEDVSSDILDCSRTTDVDNDQILEEISNVNNDASSINAPSIPVTSRTEMPVNQDLQDLHISAAKNFPSESSKDNKPTATKEENQSQPVVNTPALPDQWQHRFRVVKIVSSEPFKRGRWLCMDFMDPPAPAVESKPEVSEYTTSSGSQMISSSCFPDAIPADRVAHIYEISPSDAYPGSISVAVGPDHIQQPMYGIFLPVNNGQYPFISGINTMAIQEEIKRSEPSAPATSTARLIQQSQIFPPSQTTTLSEAQAPFQGQQTQAVTSTVSQKPVQPVVTAQVVPQHQSQTVKAPTPPTTAQQPVVSAPIIPTPTITPPVTASIQSAVPPQQSQLTQESQISMQQRAQPPVIPQQSQPVPTSTTQAVSMAVSEPTVVISSTSQSSDLSQTVIQTTNAPISTVSVTQTSSVGTQASAAVSNIPEVTLAPSVKKTESTAVPSQVVPNHVEGKELGTPPSTNPQPVQEIATTEPTPAKSDVNGEDSESAPSGTSTVAIDNKIEQAMDLVKSHLMFAVREEVDVLKEKITELMDRISQLEYENGFLRANASQQTLEQLNQTQLLQQQQQQQNQPSSVSINSIQVTQQPTQQQQLNIQNTQSTS